MEKKVDNIVRTFRCPLGMELRVYVRGGVPWFVGREVAEILGYSNTSKAILMHVDGEDRKCVMVAHSQNGILSKSKTNIINESGLYSLILSSKLPQAREFKHWVTSEVLPQIRQTGGYIPVTAAMSDLDIMAQALQIMQRTIEHKDRLLDVQSEVIADMQPKVLFHDAVQGAEDAISISELAKLLAQNGVEMGQRRLFEWLRENGYLGTHHEFWNMPNQRYLERGLFCVQESVYEDAEGRVFTHRVPKVTGKGQTYFVNLFLNKMSNN